MYPPHYRSLLLVLVATACGTPSPLQPGQPAARAAGDAVAGLTVMTRNLYVGADVDAVIAALISTDPADDLPALLEAVTTLQLTDYPTRAEAFAREIARTRPDVVGLQEVSTIDIDLTPLGIPVTISQDFLAILQGALAAQGLAYTVAASVTNIDAAPIPGVRLIDKDVLLVRRGVQLVGPPVERNFSVNLGPVAPGVSLIRGWVAVRARVGDRTYQIASTHLESGSLPGLDLLRAAQAAELAASLDRSLPAIVMGDLNDFPDTPMYLAFAAAGFADSWTESHPGDLGYTCCHAVDLSNEVPNLTHRIDYVLVRSGGGSDPLRVRDRLVGAARPERVPGPVYPLWPSDHVGVVATLARRDAGAAARP
jgi:endonuclease/exonuclease/phosphatase family metal-dependent hydrolase